MVDRIVVRAYRLARTLDGHGFGRLARTLKLMIQITFGAEVDFRAHIGSDFRLPHPAGVVVGAGSTIGDDVQLGAGVVLGGNLGQERDGRTYPVLGSHVLVGPGAAILGPCSVCDGVIIGANTVVTNDIETSGVYAGAPARRLRSLSDYERTRIGLNPVAT